MQRVKVAGNNEQTEPELNTGFPVQSWDIIVHHLLKEPFKTVHAQIFFVKITVTKFMDANSHNLNG